MERVSSLSSNRFLNVVTIAAAVSVVVVVVVVVVAVVAVVAAFRSLSIRASRVRSQVGWAGMQD